MPKVKIVNRKQEIEVPERANLRRQLLDAGVPVHHDLFSITTSIVQVMNCHGLGQCGTCSVHVKSGMENLSPKGVLEKARLGLSLVSIGHEDEIRLSCQTKVLGDVEIETQPKANLGGKEKFW